MKSAHRQYGALIVAGLATTVPLITRAAEAPLPGADTLEEGIVTAERLAERALDVPASISVISAADIEHAG